MATADSQSPDAAILPAPADGDRPAPARRSDATPRAAAADPKPRRRGVLGKMRDATEVVFEILYGVLTFWR